MLGALSACGRFRRNGTPAPGLAASASVAHRASARFAARTLCSADILGVCICIYAVGGESCRIRARPESVRSAGGGEIARAWHVLALGSPVSPSSLPPGGSVRPPAPSAADTRRVASSRDTAPRHARASARLPRTGCPPPPCVRSSASPSDPDPTSGGVSLRSFCALPPYGGTAWLTCQPLLAVSALLRRMAYKGQGANCERRRAAGGAREDGADRRPPRWFRLPRRFSQRGRACLAILTYAWRTLRLR